MNIRSIVPQVRAILLATNFLIATYPNYATAAEPELFYIYLKCQGGAPGFRINVTDLSLQEWSKDQMNWGPWGSSLESNAYQDDSSHPVVAKDLPDALIFTRYDKKGLIDDVATVDRRTLTVVIQGFEQRPLESHCTLAKALDFKVPAPRF